MKKAWQIAIGVGLIAAAIILPIFVGKNVPATKTPTTTSDSISLIETLDQLKSTLHQAGDTLIIIDMYADWCMPCRMLSPILKSLASDYQKRALFYKVNIDKSSDIATSFGVRGIPHVVFLKKSENIYALTGLQPRENYEKVILSCGPETPAIECIKHLDN
jgi:thioredoxin 1